MKGIRKSEVQRILMVLFFLMCWIPGARAEEKGQKELRKRFVNIHDVDPGIIVEMRYYGSHNFLGTRVRGYRAPKCILTKKAAKTLSKVQKEVSSFFLSLKIYDCYRPKKAVEHFVRWAKDLTDKKMKTEFYPNVDKKDLFDKGYIALRSSHSRGSAVDLTLVPVPVPEQSKFIKGQELKGCYLSGAERFKDNSIEMGSGFDCFDSVSHTANSAAGIEALRNRLLLKSIMEKHGFKNYSKEWWHYNLVDEPFPEKYFDFDIE